MGGDGCTGEGGVNIFITKIQLKTWRLKILIKIK